MKVIWRTPAKRKEFNGQSVDLISCSQSSANNKTSIFQPGRNCEEKLKILTWGSTLKHPMKLDKTRTLSSGQTIHSYPQRFSMYSLLYACDDAVSHVYNMKTLTLSNDRIWSMFLHLIPDLQLNLHKLIRLGFTFGDLNIMSLLNHRQTVNAKKAQGSVS